MKRIPKKVRLAAQASQGQLDLNHPERVEQGRFAFKADRKDHDVLCLVPACGKRGDIAYPLYRDGMIRGYYCVAHQHLVKAYRQLRGQDNLNPVLPS